MRTWPQVIAALKDHWKLNNSTSAEVVKAVEQAALQAGISIHMQESFHALVAIVSGIDVDIDTKTEEVGTTHCTLRCTLLYRTVLYSTVHIAN